MAETKETVPRTLQFLADWRRYRFLSQRDLAQVSGVTRENIAYLETRDQVPTFATIRKLAKGLDIEPYQLFMAPPKREGEE